MEPENTVLLPRMVTTLSGVTTVVPNRPSSFTVPVTPPMVTNSHATVHNKFKSEQMKRTGYGGSDVELGGRATVAKRVELAALRKLAKACHAVRAAQERVADADVIDVPVRLTYTFPEGE
jgi:hypothetical protein